MKFTMLMNASIGSRLHKLDNGCTDIRTRWVSQDQRFETISEYKNRVPWRSATKKIKTWGFLGNEWTCLYMHTMHPIHLMHNRCSESRIPMQTLFFLQNYSCDFLLFRIQRYDGVFHCGYASFALWSEIAEKGIQPYEDSDELGYGNPKYGVKEAKQSSSLVRGTTSLWFFISSMEIRRQKITQDLCEQPYLSTLFINLFPPDIPCQHTFPAP